MLQLFVFRTRLFFIIILLNLEGNIIGHQMQELKQVTMQVDLKRFILEIISNIQYIVL